MHTQTVIGEGKCSPACPSQMASHPGFGCGRVSSPKKAVPPAGKINDQQLDQLNEASDSIRKKTTLKLVITVCGHLCIYTNKSQLLKCSVFRVVKYKKKAKATTSAITV